MKRREFIFLLGGAARCARADGEENPASRLRCRWYGRRAHLRGVPARALANATHIKGVPGRKSDMNDATWIADLLAHGLIRASFVPPQPIQDCAL